MPVCPNCGGWIPEGSHTCSCGTSISYGSAQLIDEDVDEGKLAEELLKKMARNHRDEAKRLEEEELYDEAIERYKKSLEMDYSISTVKDIANLYFKMKKYEEAIYYFNRLTKVNPSFEGYIGVGKVLAEMGKFDEAFDNFDRALEDMEKWHTRAILANSISQAYNEIGWAYHLNGNYEKAIENYEKGIEYDWEYSENWNCKAMALERMQRYKEALYAYDKAISLNDNEVLRNNMKGCEEEFKKFKQRRRNEESKKVKEVQKGELTHDHDKANLNDNEVHKNNKNSRKIKKRRQENEKPKTAEKRELQYADDDEDLPIIWGYEGN